MPDVRLEVSALVRNVCFYFLCDAFDLHIHLRVDIGLLYLPITKSDIFVLFNIEIPNLAE